MLQKAKKKDAFSHFCVFALNDVGDSQTVCNRLYCNNMKCVDFLTTSTVFRFRSKIRIVYSYIDNTRYLIKFQSKNFKMF